MRSISRLKSKSKRTKNVDKIITNKREIKKAKKIEVKARKTKIEIKVTKKSIEVDAKANATIVAIIATTTIDRKRLLKLYKQFVCTHVSLAFKIVLILLSCLLLFNNL